MIVIQWIRRPGEGETFRFDHREISLGLSPRNDLVLEGRGLLKKHCTLSEEADGTYLLTSMSGKDAAVVNGVRCFRGPVHNGDRIQIGTVHLLFLGDGSQPPPEREAVAEEAAPPPTTTPARKRSAEPTANRRPAAAIAVPEAAELHEEGGATDEPLPVNSAGGLFFPEGGTAAGLPRRGRRPIELAEVPTTTPYGQLRREIHERLRRRESAAETAKKVFEILGRRFRSAEFLLFVNDAAATPVLVVSSHSGRGFVFSRKALSEMTESPRPVATREGDRITTYFPLVAERGGVRAFLVVRGILGGLDREFLEEVAFLLSLRVAGAPAAASATGEAAPAPSATGPAIFDPESGALSESVDDLKVIGDAVERRVIDRVLRRLKGNQSKAAAVLNISRGSLIAKIRQYSLPDYRSLRRR